MSDVRIVTSLLSVAIFAIMGLFPLSLSPAQPKTSSKDTGIHLSKKIIDKRKRNFENINENVNKDKGG